MMCVIVQIIFVTIYSLVPISLIFEIGIERSMIVIEITRVEVSFMSHYKGLIRHFALYAHIDEIVELRNLLYYVMLAN